MKKSVKTVLLLYLLAFALIFMSALPLGIFSDILYVMAYAVPVFISFFIAKRLRYERESECGICEPMERLLTVKPADIPLLLPLAMPFVFGIFAVAFLTSLLLTALGMSNTGSEISGFGSMIVSHALIPALLEEMLFRYVPLTLMMPYSKKYCIVVSSLSFALFHMNLFQIPYALFAGAMFIFIDLLFESVLPSIILHFINNVLSVVFMKYCTERDSALGFFICLSLCTAVSLVAMLLLRKRYGEKIKDTFLKKEEPLPSMIISDSEEDFCGEECGK